MLSTAARSVSLVAAERHEHALADRDRVRAHRQRLGHVGARADAAGDDELHLAGMLSSSSASTAWRTAASVGMPTCSMNTSLRRRRATLHAVDHDDVGAGVNASFTS